MTSIHRTKDGATRTIEAIEIGVVTYKPIMCECGETGLIAVAPQLHCAIIGLDGKDLRLVCPSCCANYGINAEEVMANAKRLAREGKL